MLLVNWNMRRFLVKLLQDESWLTNGDKYEKNIFFSKSMMKSDQVM